MHFETLTIYETRLRHRRASLFSQVRRSRVGLRSRDFSPDNELTRPREDVESFIFRVIRRLRSGPGVNESCKNMRTFEASSVSRIDVLRLIVIFPNRRNETLIYLSIYLSIYHVIIDVSSLCVELML
jgi:hypothetical protein